MTSNQLLGLLKREILAAQQADEKGNVPSLLGALELIELYKIQIQNETINNILGVCEELVRYQKKRNLTADSISREYENLKNTLVK